MDNPIANVIVIGAGGHARVVAESIGLDRVAGFLAPDGGQTHVDGLGARLGSDDDGARLSDQGHQLAMGVGFVDRPGAERRARILTSFDGLELLTVANTRASVAQSATIRPGAFVAAGAIVGTSAVVSEAAMVNSGAILDHDVVLGKNVHVGPGAVISGSVSIGDDTLVGVGSTIRQGVRIGARVVIGAGAVVLDDVADDATVFGVPARPVRTL